jgi:hypothetical protein
MVFTYIELICISSSLELVLELNQKLYCVAYYFCPEETGLSGLQNQSIQF